MVQRAVAVSAWVLGILACAGPLDPTEGTPQQELSAGITDLLAATDAAGVAQAWVRLDRAAVELERTAKPEDIDTIGANGQGYVTAYGVEGTVFVEFPIATWRKRAAATADTADDRFLDLYDAAYGNARRTAWAKWITQLNDVSGCSKLGDGVVFDVLQKAVAARSAGALFAAPIASVRAEAIAQIGHSVVQYCRDDGSPRTNKELRSEAKRILDTIALDVAERAAIEAALPTLRGEPFSGG